MRVNEKARGGDSKYDLANIMKLVAAVVFTLAFALLNLTEPAPKHQATLDVGQTAYAAEPAKADKPAPQPEPAAAAPAAPAFDANNPATWPKCQNDEFVRADNGKCQKRPHQDAPNATAAAQTTSNPGGSGSCQAEIAKYDWNVTTALAVGQAESGHATWKVNNNPATGDYSVGCMQINIYGGNARSRPSEAQLKDASVNVAFAYKLYSSNGNSFIGQWGVCRDKVNCY